MAEYSNERIEKIFKDFASAIQKTGKKFAKFAEMVEKIWYAEYEKADCPYGRNPAGYGLWVEEQMRLLDSVDSREN